jgi:hypothetical protein
MHHYTFYDKKTPDRYEVIGSIIVITGAIIIMSTFLAIASKLKVCTGRILAFYIKKIFTEVKTTLGFYIYSVCIRHFLKEDK